MHRTYQKTFRYYTCTTFQPKKNTLQHLNLFNLNSFSLLFGGATLGLSMYIYSNNKSHNYQCSNNKNSNNTNNINTNTNNSQLKSDRIQKEEILKWFEICKLCNKEECNLQRALNWTLKDYLLWYASILFSGGIGFFITPLFSFWVLKQHIKKIRFGKLTGVLDASFTEYLFEVYLTQLMYGFFTFGIYFLLGFDKRMEAKWIDEKISWKYIPQKEIQSEKEY